MTIYRLIIARHGRLLGHFESSAPWALEALRDIAASLPAGAGYHLRTQVSDGERRLLESTPAGTRVLASEHVFAFSALDLGTGAGHE